MKNASYNELANQLAKETPLARALLEASWDDLSFETQLHVLLVIRHQTLEATTVLEKALASPSIYMRYLVALCLPKKIGSEQHAHITLVKKIQTDPSPWVRAALFEQSSVDPNAGQREEEGIYSIELNADTYEQELARISVPAAIEPYGLGIHLAYYADYLLAQHESGAFSDVQLTALLNQLICTLKCARLFRTDKALHEGHDAALNPIWALATRLPEPLTMPIIHHMPLAIGGVPKVEKAVLMNLSDKQLVVLLSRPDCVYSSFRKEVFLDDERWTALEVKKASASRHLPLTYEDLDEILYHSETNTKLLALKEASYLEACMIECIQDQLRMMEAAKLGEKITDARYRFELRDPELPLVTQECQAAFSKHMQTLSKDKHKQEAVNLSLYRMAKASSEDIKETLSDELSFLNDLVIPERPWTTFIRFHQALFPEAKSGLYSDSLEEDREEGVDLEQKKGIPLSKKVKYASIVGAIIIAAGVIGHWWFIGH